MHSTKLHGTGRRSLVFGASGYIGTNLVPRLLAHGDRVRAAARNLNVLESRQWQGVETCAADALRPESLPAALSGCDVAYYLVHSMAAGRHFGRLDVQAADNFAAAADEAGLRRIVYLGGLVPVAAESEHLTSRRDTGRALRRGRVPVTEVRAGMIIGPGSAAFEVIRDLVNHLPVMVTPRWVYSRSPPIALGDLLEYLIRIADIEEAAGQVYDAAGPESLTYEQLMRQYGELVNKRPLIVPVPLLSPRLSSYWLHLVTSVPTRIARALVAGLSHDIEADDAALRALVPQSLKTYRQAVASALKAEREHTVAARWVEGALMFRGFNPQHGFYAKRASGSALAKAEPADVWRVVSAIGGRNRYYFLNALWSIREMLDWLLGGAGRKRGRRHPSELRIGDAVDSWRVVGLERERRLTLMMGMKAPGAGVLEFELDAVEGGTRLTATAYWHPAGVWGLLYWYLLAPFHGLIFRGMTREIARRAERAGVDSPHAPGENGAS